MKLIILALSIAFASFDYAAASAGMGPAGDMNCEPRVKAALAAKGITDEIKVAKDAYGNSPAKDYLYWYTLPSCSTTGYVLVRATNGCYIQEVFTRWGCRVPGVRHYRF
jgi:hypothetical protein